jgi:SLOG in TRPM, prokaryote
VHEAFVVDFPNRHSATAVRVSAMDELPLALRALGLTSRPTLVLVGGADGLTGAALDELRALFVDTIAPLVEKAGAQVIDGATDSGVVQLIGRARGQLALSFPLIGVAAIGNVSVPGEAPEPDAVRLEPNHSHFLLVAGKGWGEESPWIARLASALANGERSVTLLVNGGEISWADVSASVAEGRSTVAVAGSGGTADAVVAHLLGTQWDQRVEPLASSGLLVATQATDEGGSVGAVVRQLLGGDD